MIYIYQLTNRANGKMYIGQTIALARRWKQHCEPKCSRVTYINNAIKKYGKQLFDMAVLAEVATQQEADNAETFLIHHYDTMNRSFGYNLKEGGHNGKVSEATKLKMSSSKLGNTNAAGSVHSPERRANQALIMTGRCHSTETILKISSGNLGKNVSKSTRAKISAANTGRKVSAEGRANMSVGQKNRKPPTDETRAKIGFANSLRIISDETRAKMRAAHERRRLAKQQQREIGELHCA